MKKKKKHANSSIAQKAAAGIDLGKQNNGKRVMGAI